ncbi:DnaJ-like protein [Smittium mucronatum]|uniref:DnaJ-like protein n=1 Tax=Smittium mucronatum TaxID=133383 RepID=A0A1R0H6A6_9FUNG|nr:DnaJ-like protein [Smittium mucronatum]
MVVNLDEAEKCLDLAKKKFSQNDIEGAIRFANKSIRLHPLPEAQAFLNLMEKKRSLQKDSPSEKSSASTTPQPKPKPSTTEKSPSSNSSTYTKDQVDAVKKILSIKNDYYAVLGVDKGAQQIEIKKSYRKMALQFHPDKNKAPGADEAFKIVSRAFTTLSDDEKKRTYDMYGGETAERTSSSSNYSRAQNFTQYESEINPEDLFNMFFGGQEFGFGEGPRMRTYVNRSQRGYNRFHDFRQQQQPQDDGQGFYKLVPLIIFFAIMILSNLFAGFFSEPETKFSFSRTRVYNTLKHTGPDLHDIPFYVNNREFSNSGLLNSSSKLKKFQRDVFETYVQNTRSRCREQMEFRQEQIHDAHGFLGLFVDQEKLHAARNIQLPACDLLNRLI